MPADDFTSCKTKDDSSYDYFACQFFDSLTRYQTTDPKGYWLGRLITYDYAMNNLALDNEAGENFTEDLFREDLENSDIIFHSYTLLEVNYDSGETTGARSARSATTTTVQVTGKVELDVTINETRQTITRDFSHTIKQCWQATETVFS